MKELIRSIYLTGRFYKTGILLILLFVISYLLPWLYGLTVLLMFLWMFIFLTEAGALWQRKRGIKGYRFTPDKLSNGDENELRIFLENHYSMPVFAEVIDEIPHQFQKRDAAYRLRLEPRNPTQVSYYLRPVKRGEYNFGHLNVYVQTVIGLVKRRYRFSSNKTVPVYPSYLQMRKYELLAIHNQLMEMGIKKIRRIGHNMEFEQIKEYVAGDDIRTINWKATARRNELMVNSYQDERSQQIYSVIDKGRVMEMPFDGMTLLDYAINASLVISNIAMKKDDKAGLITFQHRVGTVLPASRRNNQMFLIQEALYNQKTSFRETDFSRLYSLVRCRLRQRSLLLLYTNFESRISLERELGILASLARNHVLVVVLFINTELDQLLEEPAGDMTAIYHKGAGEKFAYEKKLIARDLQSRGVYTILTKPSELTVNTINKYLELKARGII